MRKLFLIAVFLGLVASPSLVSANERIISFDADNFTNISTDPSFRWSMERKPFRPLADGIRLDEFTGSPRFYSTSPSTVQEIDDCIVNSCIQMSGGSPDMELYTSNAISSHIAMNNNWSLSYYFKFTDLPSADTVLASVYSPVAGERSWSVEYVASTSRVSLTASSNGTTFSTLTASSGEILVNTWYLFTIKHSTGSGNTVVQIWDSEGNVTTGLIFTITPYNGTSQPLNIMANSNTRNEGGISNWEDDYNIIIDEVLLWNTDFGTTEWRDLTPLIPQPSILSPEITNYQLTAAVEATNNTGSIITNRTIPFTVNFEDLVDFGFLDSSLKDFYVLDDSFSDIDYMITAGNPASNGSYVFAEVPSIADTQTYTINELVGLSTTNQNKIYEVEYPFIFTGDDFITVPDTAVLDPGRAFSASIAVSIDSIPSTDAWLLDKLNAGLTTGYGILINTSGDIVTYINDQTCTIPASSISYPINDSISFSVSNAADGDPNLSVRAAIGSDIEVGCNLATGATPNSEDIIIGTDFVGNIYTYMIFNDIVQVARLFMLFRPIDFIQTQEGNAGNSYTWEGNLTTFAGITPTYTIVSDLTNININQTGLIVNTAEEIPIVPTPNPNIIGTPPSVVTTPAPSVNLPFTPLILDSADNIGITDQAMWFILFYTVAVMFAFGTHILLNTEFLSIMVLSSIVLLGTLSDVYAAWLTAATLPLVIGVYALTQLRRVGEIA